MQIPMQPGDRVVTAFQFRDFVLVVTEQGAVLKIDIGDVGGDTRVRVVEP